MILTIGQSHHGLPLIKGKLQALILKGKLQDLILKGKLQACCCSTSERDREHAVG